MISVIIPLYNKSNTIEDTLNSVLSQAYSDFEIVVVDDGSTDDSCDKVKRIDDSRIRLICKPNSGPSSARNRGVQEAHGEWIVFLDADDRFEPDALDHFANLTITHKGYRVYCCNFYIEVDGRRGLYSRNYHNGEIKNNFRSWFWGKLMPCQGTTLYARELLLEHPYDERLRRYEDVEMFYDIMREYRIYRSPYPTFTYIRDCSLASKRRENFNDDFLAHLDPKGKSFWERMVLHKDYFQARRLYPKEVKALYSDVFTTHMDLCAYALLRVIYRLINKIKRWM